MARPSKYPDSCASVRSGRLQSRWSNGSVRRSSKRSARSLESSVSGHRRRYGSGCGRPRLMAAPGQARRPRRSLRSGAEEGSGRAAPGQRDFEVGLGFLRGVARPPTSVLITFIDAHRGEFGVEPICRVLSEHGVTIAPSSYYEARHRVGRPPRSHELRFGTWRGPPTRSTANTHRCLTTSVRTSGLSSAVS